MYACVCPCPCACACAWVGRCLSVFLSLTVSGPHIFLPHLAWSQPPVKQHSQVFTTRRLNGNRRRGYNPNPLTYIHTPGYLIFGRARVTRDLPVAESGHLEGQKALAAEAFERADGRRRLFVSTKKSDDKKYQLTSSHAHGRSKHVQELGEGGGARDENKKIRHDKTQNKCGWESPPAITTEARAS